MTDVSSLCKQYIANWMVDNYSSLSIGSNYDAINFYTTGKKISGWKRRGKGKVGDREFRVFQRYGTQDMKKPNLMPEDIRILPKEYAVVWTKNGEVVDMEWMHLGEAVELAGTITNSIGHKYTRKDF